MRTPRPAWALLLALGISGCGDSGPVLHLDARGFDGDRLSLRVVEPPIARPFDCDDLAFGAVALDDALLGARAQLDLSGADESILSGLSRTANLLLVAEATAPDSEGLEDRKRTGVGCAEIEGRSSSSVVELTVEAIAIATIPEDASLQGALGRGLDMPVRLSVTDVHGVPIIGRAVRITTHAAQAEPVSRTETTSELGVLVAPLLPDRPGPFATDVAVRWTGRQSRRIPGFARRDLIETEVEPGKMVLIGRFRDRGLLSAAVLDPTLHTVSFCPFAGGRIECVAGDAVTLPASSFFTGLVRLDGGEGVDRVLVVAIDGWWEASHGTPIETWAAPTGPSSPGMFALLQAGGCPRTDAVLISGAIEREVRDKKGVVSSPISRKDPLDLPGPLSASGCVSTDAEGRTLARAYVGADLLSATTILVETESLLAANWAGAATPFAFVADLEGRRLLGGAQFQLEDRVLSSAVLSTSASALSLRIAAVDVAKRSFAAIDAGDVDGDGRLDWAAVLSESTPASPTRPVAPPDLWLSLDKSVGDGRIGGTLALTSSCASAVYVGDVDGNRIDDVVIDETCRGSVGTLPPLPIDPSSPQRFGVMLMN